MVLEHLRCPFRQAPPLHLRRDSQRRTNKHLVRYALHVTEELKQVHSHGIERETGLLDRDSNAKQSDDAWSSARRLHASSRSQCALHSYPWLSVTRRPVYSEQFALRYLLCEVETAYETLP